ncbi:MAG: SNF2-related protein [Fuerstiella sp.]
MTTRTRDWLRTFVTLGARAEKDGIPLSDVERQEHTVIRALDMLDERPGIVLADEVGMGKTFEALGIAAAMRHVKKRARIVVVTPGPDLNRKWYSEFSRFKDMYDFGDDVRAARRLPEFVELVREHPVVVAPITMFQSGRGSVGQTYLLSLFFHWKNLHGKTANAIMARFRDGEHERVDVEQELFLGVFELSKVERHLRKAFRRGRSPGDAGLDDLFKKDGYKAFENQRAVRRALYRARFVLTGKLMPTIDLLIVDEAHKLKNPNSLRTSAMRKVFGGSFRKALFLTATPFQLDVSELREIFSLFAGAKNAPDDLEDQIETLLAAVDDYQIEYEAFQQTWSSLDPAVAAEFRTLYDNDPSGLNDIQHPALMVVAKQIESLKELKTSTIAPGFRQWMIRSLRDEKRVYRNHIPRKIHANGAEALPFLIYERFIAELFRQGRQTHKAAVEINMVSSYAAAKSGSILSDDKDLPQKAEVYRQLLMEILNSIEPNNHEHPKGSDSITDALDAANRGEKTLIFCSRVATLEQLRRELDAIWETWQLTRWRRVYPDAAVNDVFDSQEIEEKRRRGRHSLLQARFQRTQDALCLALREPYLRTLAPVADWARKQLPEIVRDANETLQGVRVGKTAAERLDYQIAKRCVEQATARLWHSCNDSHDNHHALFRHLLDDEFVPLGLDLAEDEFEHNPVGDVEPAWRITERVALMAIGDGGSLWELLSDHLEHLSGELRVRVVEQLARYLTYKQVPFIAELLLEAKQAGLSVDPIESAAMLGYMSKFWQTMAGERWLQQLREFLTYFCDRDPVQQLEILNGPIRTGDFARHTKDGESRERLREAFNTPLYPMILIANEVMQEGLDLHKNCRRIVHHDLGWNPAQIEQRVGRIDRLGSLTNRLRKNNADATLDVLYPLISGTIDERLYRTVKTREKWLEFLLGAPPSFSEYTFADEEPPPLPDRLGTELAIDLGPN